MLLGLDLGTTNVKALLAERDGRVVARAASPVRLLHLPGGGVEQEIDEIWTATLNAIRTAVAAAGNKPVEAIGVSSQGGALQVLDEHGSPHGRVISWLDARGRRYDEALTAELGREWFIAHTGRAGSALTPGQLLRLHAEQRMPPRARTGFVGDVIVGRLCGRAAHDGTSLSLAMLYNPAQRRADPELLARLQLDEARLPALASPRTAAGALLPEVASATGLPPDIPVSPAIHDQYASALAADVTAAGTVMVGTGTAWVLLLVSDALPPPLTDSAFVCTHIVQKLYGQILSLGNGGSALAWALDLTGCSDCTGEQLDALLERVPAGCDGLRVKPYFAALGYGRQRSAGSITGLRLHHGMEHLVRAVLEGLVCELMRYLSFARQGGVALQELVLCGAAARSRVTPQVIADVSGLDVACVAEHDTSALGAAMLARGLLEPDMSLPAIAAAMEPATHSIAPGSERDLYADLLKEYLHAT
jgi:sugar (pentulose or hexulose) kinase